MDGWNIWCRVCNIAYNGEGGIFADLMFGEMKSLALLNLHPLNYALLSGGS